MTEVIREKAKASMLSKNHLENETNICELERGIYNWCVDFYENNENMHKNNIEDFEKLYNEKFVSIMINLETHKTILDKFNNGDLLGRDLAYFKAYEWDTLAWQPILSEKLKRQTASSEVEQSRTDLFKCGKCKQKNTSYFEMQIRSADESATIFITCLNPKCKNQWRIG